MYEHVIEEHESVQLDAVIAFLYYIKRSKAAFMFWQRPLTEVKTFHAQVLAVLVALRVVRFVLV